MEISERHTEPHTGDSLFVVRVHDLEMKQYGDKVAVMVMQKIAEEIAAQYLERHSTEVLSRINPEAVANMAIAEAGAEVNDTLKRKYAKEVVERMIEKPTVYQRGIFGGLRRL